MSPKRTLAQQDEISCFSIYQVTRPETEKIAVKVINQFGDEVLKVFSI